MKGPISGVLGTILPKHAVYQKKCLVAAASKLFQCSQTELNASVSTVTRLTEPDCDTEFHRAVCWALYFSLFTALACHISSKRMVFVTMCTLTTHNSMLTFHLTIRRLQPTRYPGVSST